MLSLLFGKIKLYLLAAAGLVTAVIGIYFKGKADEKQKEKVRDLKTYKETRKELDDVEAPTDSTNAREWLSKRK